MTSLNQEEWQRQLEKEHAEFDKLMDELTPALGELVVEFGRLELAASEFAGASLGVVGIEQRDAIDAVLSFRQKLDLIAALVPSRISKEEDRVEVRKAIARMGEFEVTRNRLLHSFWGLGGKSEVLLVRSKRRADRKAGLICTEEGIKVEEIRRLSDDIRQFCRLFGGQGTLYHAAMHFPRAGADQKSRT